MSGEQLYTLGENGDYVAYQAPEADETSANYWSDRNSGVIRGQWDHWREQSQPLEQEFADKLLDPTKRRQLRNNSMDYVKDAVTSNHQRGLSQLARRDQRYGKGLTALEQQSRTRKMQATKQATMAKGLTDMSGYLDDREQQMMSGGISYNPGQKLNGMAGR